MESSPSAEDANYYGHYPYEIEDHYFSQGNLEVKPGVYRQTTVSVDSFSENPLRPLQYARQCKRMGVGLLRRISNRRADRPVGSRLRHASGFTAAAAGTTSLKNMRSAYRATLEQNKGSFNLGIRLVLNAEPGSGSVSGTGEQTASADGNGRIFNRLFLVGREHKGHRRRNPASDGRRPV